MAGRRGAPAAVRGAESEALTLQNTEQLGRHAGRGGTRSGRWAGPGHVWPGGSPELQVQGRRETGQVEQRVEHLHGSGGIQQGWEEPHKLGGQGRAVPGQELGGGDAGGSAGPLAGGGHRPGGKQAMTSRGCRRRAATGQGRLQRPPTLHLPVTQGPRNTPFAHFFPLFFLLLRPLPYQRREHFHLTAALSST